MGIANFTIDQLIDEVKKLAIEKPDFIYPSINGSCFYGKSATSETEGCIFGQAIFRLQPESKELIKDSKTGIQVLDF